MERGKPMAELAALGHCYWCMVGRSEGGFGNLFDVGHSVSGKEQTTLLAILLFRPIESNSTSLTFLESINPHVYDSINDHHVEAITVQQEECPFQVRHHHVLGVRPILRPLL
jgi:hypothetical protein